MIQTLLKTMLCFGVRKSIPWYCVKFGTRKDQKDDYLMTIYASLACLGSQVICGGFMLIYLLSDIIGVQWFSLVTLSLWVMPQLITNYLCLLFYYIPLLEIPPVCDGPDDRRE